MGGAYDKARCYRVDELNDAMHPLVRNVVLVLVGKSCIGVSDEGQWFFRGFNDVLANRITVLRQFRQVDFDLDIF